MIYKCIAKVMANRLQVILGDIFGNQQNFIDGRRIGENILLAHELLRNYHRDKGTPRCALKVDLIKVYDYVRWDFILVVLRTIGVPEVMVRLVSPFVSMVSSRVSFLEVVSHTR